MYWIRYALNALIVMLTHMKSKLAEACTLVPILVSMSSYRNHARLYRARSWAIHPRYGYAASRVRMSNEL